MENSLDKIAKEDDDAYAQVFAAFQTFTRTVNGFAQSPSYDDSVVAEAASADRLEAEPFGMMLMQYFDWEKGPNTELKQFLVQVAATLGPDHIENLRRSVAFMQKVDSF